MNPKEFADRSRLALEKMAYDWADCTEAERKQALATGKERLASIVAAIAAGGSATQQPEWMAMHYIRLKSEWITLNNTMNYQLFSTGKSDPVVMLTGSLIWVLLDALEPYLQVEDIEIITAFLTQSRPVAGAGKVPGMA